MGTCPQGGAGGSKPQQQHFNGGKLKITRRVEFGRSLVIRRSRTRGKEGLIFHIY